MTFLIAALSPFYVTLFWAVVFLLNAKRDNPSRLILGVFMIFSSTLFFAHAVFFLGHHRTYLLIDSIYLFTSLSVYPLYYWYVKILTRETAINLKNLFHLLPGLVLAITLTILHLTASNEDRWSYFQSVLIENDFNAIFHGGHVGQLAVVYYLSRLVFAIQVFYYLISGYYLAMRYNERLAEFYSNLKKRQLVWVKMLSLVFLFTSIASSSVNIIGRGYFLGDLDYLIIPSVAFSVLLFLIGFEGSLQEYTIKDVVHDESEYEPISGHVDTRDKLKEEILEVFEREELFRMPDLRITLLCKKLSTNRTYISGVINEEFGESFNTFVNRYRINYARELIKNSKTSNYSLDYVASESGFGSASSFIRAFKQSEGITPGRYMKMNRGNEQ